MFPGCCWCWRTRMDMEQGLRSGSQQNMSVEESKLPKKMKYFKRTRKYLYNWQVYRANWFPCFTILAKQLLQFWGLLLRCHVRPLLDIDIGYWILILSLGYSVILLIKWLTGPQKTRGFLWLVTTSTWAPAAKGKTYHQTKYSSSGRRNVQNTAGTEHTWRFR